MTGRWNWLNNVNNGCASGTAMKVLEKGNTHTHLLNRVPKK